MLDAEKFFTSRVPPYIQRFMQDMNCGKYDACAVFGNSALESAGWTILQEIKPTIPGSKGGYGIMQWTGPRRESFLKFCKERNIAANELESNYLYLVHELKNTVEGRVMKVMFDQMSLDAKVIAFEHGYLRAGVKNYDARKRWARFALLAYDAWITVEPPVPPVIVDVPKPTPEITQKAGLISGIIAALIAIGYAIGKGIGIW